MILGLGWGRIRIRKNKPYALFGITTFGITKITKMKPFEIIDLPKCVTTFWLVNNSKNIKFEPKHKK